MIVAPLEGIDIAISMSCRVGQIFIDLTSQDRFQPCPLKAKNFIPKRPDKACPFFFVVLRTSA